VKVQQQINGNDYTLSLVRILGSAVVALITLAQLASDNRYVSGGPTWLDPASITSLIAGAVLLGLAYGNLSYASAQLRNRLTAGTLAKDADVPNDVKLGQAQLELGFGVALMIASVGFFLGYLWT
jgi:hypothetical protein